MNLPAETIGQPIDWMVMLVYFVAIIAFGAYFARYTRSTSDFFFGGQRFAWWLIAFSSIATTVGSYSFVKYSEMGYSYGVSSTQTYFNDWFWMPILVLVWLPIIYYQRIVSVPEYFERRFGRATRVVATLIVIVYLVAYIGINLYTLGQVLETLIGWPVMLGAALTAAAVVIYVVAGGQTSVIMTDLVQGVILLVVGVGVLLAGVWHFGGFGEFWGLLPESHKYAFSELTAPDKFSALGIFVQDGIVNSGAFILMNQGIIMRFLSMKSVSDARKMAVCWILILAPLAAIATGAGGWIARALVENNDLQTNAKESFIHASHFLFAPGVFGFVLAALTAALMSTADTLINAVSAIFVNDIWRRFFRPQADDRHHLRVARWVSLIATVIGLSFVLVYMRYGSIYTAHAMITASVPAPMVVAVLFALFWKRFTPAACLAVLVGGSVIAGISFIPAVAPYLVGPFSFGMGEDSYTFMRALFLFVVCSGIAVVVTPLTRPKPMAELAGLVAGTQVQAMHAFKGSPPNRTPGGKATLRLVIAPALDGTGIVETPRDALGRMAAEPGDVLYVCDTRWWLGGLKSVHVRAGETAEAGVLRIGTDAAADGHLREGQNVIVEKII